MTGRRGKLPVFPRDALLADQVASVRARFADERSPESAIVLAEKTDEVAPRVALAARAPTREWGERARALACQKACAHCCRQRVVVYGPEVLRIARAVAALPEEERRALEARVARADEASRALTRDERLASRAPCPLLEDDMCKVHESRPLSCRGQNSYDARLCQRRAEGERGTPELLDETLHLAHAHVGAALGAALVREGIDGRPLELVAALRIAIERENAGERWAQGMPVFLAARAIEGGGQR